jgi:hypothetical protein
MALSFIDALREIVVAMPAFRDEATVLDIHEALNAEEAARNPRYHHDTDYVAPDSDEVDVK